MHKVTILAMYNTMASTVIGPMDVFYQAGVLWNYFNGQNLTPYFEVKVVTTNGAPFKCLSGARMIPDGSIYDVQESDLIVVSSILDIEKPYRYRVKSSIGSKIVITGALTLPAFVPAPSCWLKPDCWMVKPQPPTGVLRINFENGIRRYC